MAGLGGPTAQTRFYYSAGFMYDLGGNSEGSAIAISSWDIPVGIESVQGLSPKAVYYSGGNLSDDCAINVELWLANPTNRDRRTIRNLISGLPIEH